jgi:alkaline phosphatase
MNSLPAQGLTATHSEDALITDSAAAGTALACGAKTANGVVAMDAAGKRPLNTLAEIAKDRGMRVGIVSNVSIDHATPAVFYAHQPTRNDYYEIGLQLARSDFDYFAGGQMRGNLPGQRKDRKCLVKIARENGFAVAAGREEMAALKPGRKAWVFDEAVDGSAALQYEMDRPESQPSLAELTRKGIELLDGDEGFFIMVEAGKIDWASHANDPAATIRDTLAFDDAVAEAVAFWREHPKRTLVVVTADHECGGMTVGSRVGGSRFRPAVLAGQRMSQDVFAARVARLRRNGGSRKQAVALAVELFGLDDLGDRERRMLEAAAARSMTDPDERARDGQSMLAYGKYDPLALTACRILSDRAGIGWSTFSHTGVPVPTSAVGVNAGAFQGCYDNTDIFGKILSAMNAGEATAAGENAKVAGSAK